MAGLWDDSAVLWDDPTVLWDSGEPTAETDTPGWTPSLAQVAAYVPHRTLVRDTASTISSQDTYLFTFDDTTTPSGDQVTQLITDACAWVTARVVSLNSALEDLAGAAAALLAAAWVERSWPDDASSLQRANDMEKRADAMLRDLIDANNAAGGTGDYGLDIAVPYWSFPCPNERYDYSTYW